MRSCPAYHRLTVVDGPRTNLVNDFVEFYHTIHRRNLAIRNAPVEPQTLMSFQESIGGIGYR
jgi:hypothetical protein